MGKLVKTVKVDEKVRDYVQRLHVEFETKARNVRGLIEDHAFDANPEEFLSSAIFKAYEKQQSEAFFQYDTAVEELKRNYLPPEFAHIDNYKWELNYETCDLTYQQM